MDKIEIQIDSMLKELIPQYLETRKKEIVKLKEFLQTNEIHELERLAHKMAGNSGSYGFHQMGKYAKELELLCQQTSQDGADDLIAKIEHYINHLEIKYI